MFVIVRNCSLFQQLIIPMLTVGVIGIGAIVISAFALENSVEALGELYSSGGEQLQVLQDIEKRVADVRALSLKHLASENARDMERIASELAALTAQVRASLPGIAEHHNRHRHYAVVDQAISLRRTLEAYLAGMDASVRLSAEFEKEAAFEVLTQTEGRHLAAIEKGMQALTRHTFEDIAASRHDLVGAANRNLHMTLGIGVLGGALLLGVAFYGSADLFPDLR